MKTVLLSPELFLADGGIARILRLYLRALGELAAPGDTLDSIVLNDAVAPDPRLARYTTPALRSHVGCARDRFAFVRATLRAAWRADRLICGHLHQLPVAWLARVLRPRLRYGLVAHGIEVWRPYTVLETRALRGAHRILCVSAYTRRQLLRFCPALDPARLVVVPNTLDPCLDAPPPAPLASASLSGPRLLAVGRLTASDRYKGFDTLIEALPRVRQAFPLAHLRIVGTGDDLSRLRELAVRVGAAPAVHFLGRLDDDALRAEYAACEVFALPSRAEGFGLVYLEAMVQGKPCLAARAGAAPEVVTDATGALVPYGDSAAIAAAIMDLARHPRDAAAIRAHAATFAFPAFRARLAVALSSSVASGE